MKLFNNTRNADNGTSIIIKTNIINIMMPENVE